MLVSEFLLKRGATEVANTDSAWSWTGVNGLASPLVWWAILLIIASFISWLYVLRYIPITIAFPLSRVVDILVPLGCWIFLGELISAVALVRDCAGCYWIGAGRETDRTNRGTLMRRSAPSASRAAHSELLFQRSPIGVFSHVLFHRCFSGQLRRGSAHS